MGVLVVMTAAGSENPPDPDYHLTCVVLVVADGGCASLDVSSRWGNIIAYTDVVV